jgi:hypothetical protein
MSKLFLAFKNCIFVLVELASMQKTFFSASPACEENFFYTISMRKKYKKTKISLTLQQKEFLFLPR